MIMQSLRPSTAPPGLLGPLEETTSLSKGDQPLSPIWRPTGVGAVRRRRFFWMGHEQYGISA
jgi:hypothetical protein